MHCIQKEIQNTNLGTCQPSEFFSFLLKLFNLERNEKLSIHYSQNNPYCALSINSFFVVFAVNLAKVENKDYK